MAEVIAPAPPGVQSTFEKPLGPQPSKSEHAQKFRKAFAELTQADVKPKEAVKPDLEKGAEVGTPDQGREQPDTQKKAAEAPTPPSDKKPESPLDAVLSKTPTKEPEKVEEPDVLKEFDDVKTPQSEHWHKLKGIAANQKTELNTLREKMKALEAAPKAEPSVIEALTKERDELQAKFKDQEERLKAINYRYSDEYQQIVKDRENVLGKISSRVKSYGGNEKGLIEALQLPEGKIRTAQIKEAMADIDSDDKPRIYALLEQLEAHDEKLADAEKNAAPKWDELATRRDAQLEVQSQNAIKQLENEFVKVAETIPTQTVTLREVPDDVPGAAEWNAAIREARETALKVLKPGGADFNTSVDIALKGARYDSFEKWALGIYSDYKELQSKYNEAVGAGPDFKGGTKAKVDVQKSAPKKYHETLAAIKSGQMGEF